MEKPMSKGLTAPGVTAWRTEGDSHSQRGERVLSGRAFVFLIRFFNLRYNSYSMRLALLKCIS